MNSLLSTMHSLRELFDTKMKEFADEVDVNMVWLDEIQEEAIRMFSSDFSAEPELMPKTPSQKKSNRRKRVSVGRTDNRGKRRFSRGARSNLRSSTHLVQTLGLITENVTVVGAGAAPDMEAEQPKRNTRRNKQRQASIETEVVDNASSKGSCLEMGKEAPMEPGVQHATDPQEPEVGAEVESGSSVPQPQPPAASPPQLTIGISAAERNSAELLLAQEESGDQGASKMSPTAAQESGAHAAAPRRSSARRVSVRCSLSGLRRSMTQQAVRRASRRSFLKKKARLSSSSGEVFLDTDGEEAADQMDGVLIEEPVEEVVEPEVKVVMVEEEKAGEDVRRFTRSMAQTNTPLGPPAPPSNIEKVYTSGSDDSGKKPLATISSLSTKRLGSSTEDLTVPRKKPSPPNKSQSAIKPNMKSFLHTVQKNQILMSTPVSMGRNAVMKSFIKYSTPVRVDLKERERLRLEALKKKQEQELERKKKLEEEKKRKQEEMKRKRDERLRKVVEARVKEEQKEEEKKKKIEQKMAQMEEKNDKMRVERIAEEKAKKKVASKRQEELELRRKLQEEEAAKKMMQQEEEEKRQQELQAKRRAEEEQERARKLAEARRAQELRREQEREREREWELRREQERQRELEREREWELRREREKERLRQQQAAAERERMEREKAEALRRELELAAREKERKEAEERSRKEAQERQKTEEEKAALQKQAAAAKNKEELQQSLVKTPVSKSTVLNVTVEHSPQSYEITPKGGNKPVIISNPEDYGMDQNSDDSTDDESAPRKPIPSWAEGRQLQQAMMHQYFNPVDVDSFFGEIEDPQLERIFYKSKPRYFKRTSSAVWHSPPRAGAAAF
ncbi:inner centromere protein isoform X2 [Brienomyrus brachyistius]|uniref:inner centromere protein isoform X2 n=1 Tax=Brienomyrus brachyistius TaxID=42636 RepID=UPI0020B26616|nr:inner centromere protein isoform X2 [Brienomyrus brachyistius]